MRTAYKSLTSSDNPTFAGLLSFATDLQNSKLTLGKDAAFDQIAQQFQASNTPKLSMGYRASMAAFHVLLHETGHTFGMMHADNPDTNDITGQSSAATKNAAGQWVTSKSTMAYGDSYAYLTDDDLAGVKAATDAIKKELATHK